MPRMPAARARHSMPLLAIALVITALLGLECAAALEDKEGAKGVEGKGVARALVRSKLDIAAFGRFTDVQLGSKASPLMYIGIFTAFPRGYAASTSAARRAAIRATWMPDAVGYSHTLARFVLDPSAPGVDLDPEAVSAESAKHEDVLVLPPMDPADANVTASFEHDIATPDALRRFLAHVMKEHPTLEYIALVGDSTLLLPHRLMCAADQWAAMGADYIGCMSYERVPPEDPLAYLLAAHYPLHAGGGGPKVLSARAVREAVVLGYDDLRLEGRGDVTLALWMLATNTTYYDDRRLCQGPLPRRQCGPAAVAMYGLGAGGPKPSKFASVYGDESCHAVPKCPLPYLRSRIQAVEESMSLLRI